MADIADVLAQVTNPAYVRVTVARVLLRQDMHERHRLLNVDLAQALDDDAMLNRVPVAPGIAAEIVALEAEMEAAKQEFRFRSIGRQKWAALLAEHPPTREQLREDKRLDHNPETFPAAAIAAACTDPVMTVEQAQVLERGAWNEDVKDYVGGLNTTQFNLIWGACIDANAGGATNPKSLAAGAILRASEQFESTPAPAASPDLSSLAES